MKTVPRCWYFLLRSLLCGMLGLGTIAVGQSVGDREAAMELLLLKFRAEAVENFIEGARLLDPELEFGLFVNEWDPEGTAGMVFFSGARLYAFGEAGNKVFCFYNPLLETAWLTTWRLPEAEGLPRVEAQEWRVLDRETESGIPPWWNGQAPVINGMVDAGGLTGKRLETEFRPSSPVEVRERILVQLRAVSRLRREKREWWVPPGKPMPILGHEGRMFDPSGAHAYWFEGARPVFASPAGPFRWVAYQNPHHPRFLLLAVPEEPGAPLKQVFPLEVGQ